eukprot:2534717-Rhodomonas_salina.2
MENGGYDFCGGIGGSESRPGEEREPHASVRVFGPEVREQQVSPSIPLRKCSVMPGTDRGLFNQVLQFFPCTAKSSALTAFVFPSIGPSTGSVPFSSCAAAV